MIITEITRTYSKSINTRTYGAPESWAKIEATVTAQVESGDDAKQVSTFLFETAKGQVIAETNVLIEAIKKAVTASGPLPSGTPYAGPAVPGTGVNTAPPSGGI